MLRYWCAARFAASSILGLLCACGGGAEERASGLDPGAGGASGQAGSAGTSAEDAGSDASDCPRFVSGVSEHVFGPGQNVGQYRFPAPLFGPPRGGGCCQGSLDVVSLGNGGSVTLEFAVSAIVDGDGPDFIVFENAFNAGNDPSQVFAELGTVAVSEDGTTFVEFPCSAQSYPYGTCAGWHPVHANAETNAIDPLDASLAGGDAFDLAELGLSRARYVRITDRADQTGLAGVFDLDAVGIVNAECE